MKLDVSNYNNHIAIIGLDPGTDTLGTAIGYIDIDTFELVSIYADTFIGSKKIKYKDYGSIHNDSFKRIYALKEMFYNLLNIINPLFVTCEDNFFNRFRPAAYKSLVQVVSRLEDALYDYNAYSKLIKMSPKYIKKALGVTNIDKKISVKEAILRNEKLVNIIKSDVNMLDEHSLDAIGSIYAYYQMLLKEKDFYNRVITYKESHDANRV